MLYNFRNIDGSQLVEVCDTVLGVVDTFYAKHQQEPFDHEGFQDGQDDYSDPRILDIITMYRNGYYDE